jgi:hypothetical protein
LEKNQNKKNHQNILKSESKNWQFWEFGQNLNPNWVLVQFIIAAAQH